MNSGGTNSRRGGDNCRIIKFPEPILQDVNDNDEIPPSEVMVLEYDYLHELSPTRFANSEAIFLDHTGWGDGNEIGDVYIVTKFTKDESSKARLFRIPASAWEDVTSVYSPSAVGVYNRGGDLLREVWTGADMLLDGTLIALRSTKRIHLFPRCPGTSVAESLTGGANTCFDWSNGFSSGETGQIETIAWTPDGDQTLQISECDGCLPPMIYTTMDYDDPAQVIDCPPYQNFDSSASPTRTPSSMPVTLEPTAAPTRVPTASPTQPSTLAPSLLNSGDHPNAAAKSSSFPTISPTQASSCPSLLPPLVLVTHTVIFVVVGLSLVITVCL